MPILESAANLLTPVSGFTQSFTNVAAFSYTGANQTWVVPFNVKKIRARCWGAAGGAGYSGVDGANSNGGIGGAGGYSYAEISVTPGDTLLLVVGQGGRYSASGTILTTYGHATTTSRAAGDGASGGTGGGLSGIFRQNSFTQSNALLIAGGGGGGSGYGQYAPATSVHVRGGGGGGANLSGQDGDPQPNGFLAYGRAGTTTAGGLPGSDFYRDSRGSTISLNNDSFAGGALYGGSAATGSSWTEGGGGGAGYWGGGPGNHDNEGGMWGNGGGGSGYAISTATNVIGYSASKSTISSNATSDPYYVSGIGTPVAATTGNNGRVVFVY
jgi:hypothetical protein